MFLKLAYWYPEIPKSHYNGYIYFFLQWRICTFAARGGARRCAHGEDGAPGCGRHTGTPFLGKLRAQPACPCQLETSVQPQPQPSTNDTRGAIGKNMGKEVLHFQKFPFFLPFPPLYGAVFQEVFKLPALELCLPSTG